ncbi:hypothetical protein HDE_04859 [Halotydeus destructor]|nr:hypothetical protein HDE_04859 [Halotydeus destructor]
MALVNNNVDDKMDLSLESTLDAVGYTLHLFFENKFDLSKRHLVDNRDKSLYHSVAALYHSVCYALFTMEKDNIEEAMEQSKQTAAMIEARRKKSGFGSSITGLFTKTDYNDYTDGTYL